MSITSADWMLLATCAVLGAALMYVVHVMRELEKRTDVLERETEWIRKAVAVGELPGKYDYTIEPLSFTVPTKEEERQMVQKVVHWKFEPGDTATPQGYRAEKDDPLRGIRHYD